MNPLLAHKDRSPLMTGLRLLQQNKRLLLWLYLANLLTGLLPALVYRSQVSGILDHSMAAQRIAGRLDLSYVIELLMHTTRNGVGAGIDSLFFLLLIGYCVFSFILAAGAYYVFATGERPTLAVVERSGIEYFWRFVRLGLFSLIVFVPVIGILSALRGMILKHANTVYVERSYFLISMVTFAIVFLVAVFIRLWFDIAEAYVVQLGMDGDHRVRRSIFPAWRLLRGGCLSTYASYFLVGALGWLGFTFFIWVWMAAVPPRLVLLAWLAGQLAILSLLKARLWQRGLVTAVVFSAPASQPFLAASYPVAPSFRPASVVPEDASGEVTDTPAASDTDPASQAG